MRLWRKTAALALTMVAGLVVVPTTAEAQVTYWTQDLDPDCGVSVLAREPVIVADDFRYGGPRPNSVTWVFFDGSLLGNWSFWPWDKPHVYIFEDVPAVVDDNGVVVTPSHPGDLYLDFARWGGPVDLRAGGAGAPIFDPVADRILGDNTTALWGVAFGSSLVGKQAGETLWLGMQWPVDDNAGFGWLTSTDNNTPNAMFASLGAEGVSGPVDWQALVDPRTGEPLSMAFRMAEGPVPEPASVVLLTLGAGILVGFRRRR